MDKKVSSITAPIAFVDGESLTAAKLNAAFRNLYRGISDLETLIGDPHDSAAPYGDVEKLSQGTYAEDGSEIVAAKDLNIVNIARLIGPAEALNPKHLIKESYSITETLPSNSTKIKLKYRNIKNGSTSTDDSSLVTLVLPIQMGNPRSAGDYWIEREAGIIHCITPTTGGTFTYEIDEESVDQLENYYEASFNVIPDPSQTVKCSVALVDPGIPSYLLTMPSILNQQSNDHDNTNEIIEEGGDLNYDTQLKLPLVLRGLSTGDVIPPNFLIVKNLSTNRYLSGAVYKYASASTITIEGVTLDEGHEYQVITVGTSITETIKDINKKLTALRMGREGRDLILASKIVNDIEGYSNSRSTANVLPQYLHRDGASDQEHQTLDQGGMRGPLLMCATSKDPNETYANLDDHSNPIWFNKIDDGASIRYRATVPGTPAHNYLEMSPGTDANHIRVVDGYFRSDEGVMTGSSNFNGPFKWAKITYNGTLTGAGSDEISIDVLSELDITASQIISISGGLYLASINSFFYLGCYDPTGTVFEDHFLYPDGNFLTTLNSTYATMYSAASSANRQFKLFVHYEP